MQAVSAAEAIEDKLTVLTNAISHDEGSLSGLVRISTVDGFGATFVTPALVRLQKEHPQNRCRAVQRDPQGQPEPLRRRCGNRGGMDQTSSAQRIHLTDYFLRLYASREYLDTHGTPATVDEVRHHGFVSYVESALQVAELGQRSLKLPMLSTSFQATSIFAQNEAVRRGAGIGLLANFMVNQDPDFVPVLASEFQRQLPMWAVARPESLRSAVVEAVIRSIRREVMERQDALTG